jgi:CTP:phosphocholine cytidylyltransferase-like protein
MKRYFIIEYMGSHSFSRLEEVSIINIINHDDLNYLRSEWNLEIIKNEFSFRLEVDGFSHYAKSHTKGCYLIDSDIFKSNRLIETQRRVKNFLKMAIRDYKLKKLLND